MQTDTIFFRSLFVDNEGLTSAINIAPTVFDESTAVVVIELNHKQAGEVLGVSKVKGGNRMETTYLAAMCVVFRPTAGEATVWLTV